MKDLKGNNKSYSYGKTGDQRCDLFCNIAAKTRWKVMLPVLQRVAWGVTVATSLFSSVAIKLYLLVARFIVALRFTIGLQKQTANFLCPAKNHF